jgi:hypothetical protein
MTYIKGSYMEGFKIKLGMGIMERSAKYMVSVFRGVGCQAFRAGARRGNTAAVLSLKITRLREHTMLIN